MSIVDPVSDMLTRIRNGYAVGKQSVSFKNSKLKEAVLIILVEGGYIDSYQKEQDEVVAKLKYINGKPAIVKIERVSKPGRRVYVKKDEIPVVLSGHGMAIISTSKGIFDGNKAKKDSIGGELIAKVY